MKSAVGQTILAMGAHCQDAVQARSEKIVPTIFFAMHLKKTGEKVRTRESRFVANFLIWLIYSRRVERHVYRTVERGVERRYRLDGGGVGQA